MESAVSNGRWLVAFFYLLSSTAPAAPQVHYTSEIQPIWESRCIVCHACSQSPCQLNLASYEGARRGALNLNVYHKRLDRLKPSRLFVDGASETDWRDRGFWSILDGKRGSILWGALEAKRRQPGRPESKTTEEVLASPYMCPKQVGNLHGMPYGFPELDPESIDKIGRWLDEGAPGPSAAETEKNDEPEIIEEIRAWEKFLNGALLKERLVSRYLYEHLFLGHLYLGDGKGTFQTGAEGKFYRLVRTRQRVGRITEESRARHPYDDPQLGGDFVYRLREVQQSIVHKSHLPYELSPRKRARLQEVFFQSDWSVSSLPPYGAEGANPFTAYRDIPVWARYQFLLDDAEFFTRNDIRGPVCSGKFAVNVIQDIGWRIYLHPLSDPSVLDPEFFGETVEGKSVAELLSMPAEAKASTLESAFALLTSGFRKLQGDYLFAKDRKFAKIRPRLGVEDIWRGEGNWNGEGIVPYGKRLSQGASQYPGATQTIVRNFDNAEVVSGLHGSPKTVELMDYPLMERTYYNLVTGFDVYGSTIDGLNTRVYKDALRIEAEDQFLKLSPQKHRKKIRAYWYDSTLSAGKLLIHHELNKWHPLLPIPSLERDSKDAAKFKSVSRSASGERISRTVIAHVLGHLSAGQGAHSGAGQVSDSLRRQLHTFSGQFFPEVSFVRVVRKGRPVFYFTILANRFRTNTKFMISEPVSHVPEKDSLTVLDGPVGSFPNLYFEVEESRLPEFVRMAQVASGLKDQFGIARNHPRFWEINDDFFDFSFKRNPVEAGRFDLSRYEMFYAKSTEHGDD